jgi:hypothetical protein
MPAGERDDEGDFPEGSFNQRVDQRLQHLAAVRLKMDREADKGDGHSPDRRTDDDDDDNLAPR